jgi:hypothetical protein
MRGEAFGVAVRDREQVPFDARNQVRVRLPAARSKASRLREQPRRRRLVADVTAFLRGDSSWKHIGRYTATDFRRALASGNGCARRLDSSLPSIARPVMHPGRRHVAPAL